MGLLDAIGNALGGSEETDRIALVETVAVDEGADDVSVDDPDELQRFLDREEDLLREQVDRLVEVGADAVFCSGGIDDLARHHLEEEGLVAAANVPRSDLDSLTETVGGRLRPDPDAVTADDLAAGNVIDADADGVFRVEDPATGEWVRVAAGGADDSRSEDRIALLDGIGVDEAGIDGVVDVLADEPAASSSAEERLVEAGRTLVGAGADVVICGGEVGETVRESLSTGGLDVVSTVPEDDLAAVAETVGGRLRPDPDAVTADDLAAGNVEVGDGGAVVRVEDPGTGGVVRIEPRSEQPPWVGDLTAEKLERFLDSDGA